MSQPRTSFNIKAQVTHIALHVKDTLKSTKFFETWAGMKEVHRHPSEIKNQPVTWLSSPGQEHSFVIVLVPGATDNKKMEGLRHLGLSVGSKDEVMKIAERAKQQGILHWDYKEYKFPLGTLCAICDLDGHIIEFSYGQPLGKDFYVSDDDKKHSNDLKL